MLSSSSLLQQANAKPWFGKKRQPRRNLPVLRSFECPYRTLGVDETADETEIKRAYRKLALQHHPDVAKTVEAERKFMSIQEAYQLLTGKARGKDMNNHSMNSNSWDFHDWYWKFTQNRNWRCQGQVKDPQAPVSGPSVCSQPEHQATIRSQLAGLRHRAAVRRNSPPRSTTSPMSSMEEEELPGPHDVHQGIEEVYYDNSEMGDGVNLYQHVADEEKVVVRKKFVATEDVRSNIASQLTGLRRLQKLKQRAL